MFEQTFAAARQVDQAFMIILGFSIFILALITVLMVVFVWKYRYTKHPVAEQIHGSALLETIWIVVPTFIVLGLFWFGWSSFKAMRTVPEGAMRIQLTSRMFSWSFEYPGGKRSSVLIAPVGVPVRIDMTSADVIHSFYVPAFRIKMDNVPGMTTHVWFQADETGEYDILCAEYCGLRHANMTTLLKVVSQEEYDEWLHGGEMAEKGKELLDTYGCTACHSLDGTDGVGPTLQAVSGHEVTVLLPDGTEKTLSADRDYLKRAILEPSDEVVKGYDDSMPPYAGQIPDEDLNAMLAYLLEEGKPIVHPGRAVVENEGCIACHSTDGSELAAPTLKGLYGSPRHVTVDGKPETVVADETYLRESVTHPGKMLSEGYEDMMPPYDALSPDDMDKLIGYLKELGGAARDADDAAPGGDGGKGAETGETL